MLHNIKVHPNVEKLLKHYSTNGKIGLRPITLPGPGLDFYAPTHMAWPQTPSLYFSLYLSLSLKVKKSNHSSQKDVYILGCFPFNCAGTVDTIHFEIL